MKKIKEIFSKFISQGLTWVVILSSIVIYFLISIHLDIVRNKSIFILTTDIFCFALNSFTLFLRIKSIVNQKEIKLYSRILELSGTLRNRDIQYYLLNRQLDIKNSEIRTLRLRYELSPAEPIINTQFTNNPMHNPVLDVTQRLENLLSSQEREEYNSTSNFIIQSPLSSRTSIRSRTASEILDEYHTQIPEIPEGTVNSPPIISNLEQLKAEQDW